MYLHIINITIINIIDKNYAPLIKLINFLNEKTYSKSLLDLVKYTFHL